MVHQSETTTTITYNIEQGLRTVEALLQHDPDPRNVRFLRRAIGEWRRLMAGLSVDEGRVIEYLTLDRYAMNEALRENTPLSELRSIDQYQCWRVLEAYTQDCYQQRFFDLCLVRS